MLYERIFPRWRPKPDLRPRGSVSDAPVTVRWLGTAGHVVTTRKTTLLLDPFLTRPPLASVAFRPLAPDEAAIRRHVPTKVDAILCGHSHFDHLLDAPFIARMTGARLVGSRSTCAFARAAGVPDERLVMVPPAGTTLRVGDVEVRFVASRHGAFVPMLGVPFPGEVTAPPALPARAHAYRMGGAFGVLLKTDAGVSIYHNGSADLVDAELAGLSADVLLVGLAGRYATPNYLARLGSALSPGLIVPTHHDAFFAPLERGVHLLPKIDLDGFVAETRRSVPKATVITPDYFEPLGVFSDARGSRLADAPAAR
jgi:L-ascorbate metabolism protein UlaG (beta-lactamase superfamily)